MALGTMCGSTNDEDKALVQLVTNFQTYRETITNPDVLKAVVEQQQVEFSAQAAKLFCPPRPWETRSVLEELELQDVGLSASSSSINEGKGSAAGESKTSDAKGDGSSDEVKGSAEERKGSAAGESTTSDAKGGASSEERKGSAAGESTTSDAKGGGSSDREGSSTQK